MKKIILVLMLVVMLALTACTADKGDEAATSAAKEVTQQKWTYKLITQICSYDTERNDVVCKDSATKEETMLANLIATQASDGYELDEVLNVPKAKNTAQVFIFKKEYVAPTEQNFTELITKKDPETMDLFWLSKNEYSIKISFN